jgi:hypothetical protein
MKKIEKTATTVEELATLTKDRNVGWITVRKSLSKVPSIRLLPGQSLRGHGGKTRITFVDGADGLQLSSDNRVHNIHLLTSSNKRAIFNDTAMGTLGHIELRGVTTTGRVQILARDKVRAGHVDVKGLDIVAADARSETERSRLRRLCHSRRFYTLEYAARREGSHQC